MNISEKNQYYIKIFHELDDPASQAEYLMMLGMKKEDISELRRDSFRIEGCKTGIWIDGQEADGSVQFKADSDSLLVKGALYLFEELYQGRTKKIIKENPPAFLAAISDDVIYPEIKNNGLLKCCQKMLHF